MLNPFSVAGSLKAYLISGLLVVITVLTVVLSVVMYRGVSKELGDTRAALKSTVETVETLVESQKKWEQILTARDKKVKELNKDLLEAVDEISKIKTNDCFDTDHGDDVNRVLNQIGKGGSQDYSTPINPDLPGKGLQGKDPKGLKPLHSRN